MQCLCFYMITPKSCLASCLIFTDHNRCTEYPSCRWQWSREGNAQWVQWKLYQSKIPFLPRIEWRPRSSHYNAGI